MCFNRYSGFDLRCKRQHNMHIQCDGDFQVSLKGYDALPCNETMKLESAKIIERDGKCQIIPLTCVQKTDCYRAACR
jgi:hypothetical protein